MNSLSILAYFIGVIPNFGTLFFLGCVLTVVLTLMFALIHAGRIDDMTRYGSGRFKSTDPEVETVRKNRNNVIKKGIIFFALFGTLNALTPDKNTLTLIAASEISEKVLANKDVRDVLDPSVQYLKNWIQGELTKQKDAMQKKDSK